MAAPTTHDPVDSEMTKDVKFLMAEIPETHQTGAEFLLEYDRHSMREGMTNTSSPSADIPSASRRRIELATSQETSAEAGTKAQAIRATKPFIWDVSLTMVAEFTVMASSVVLISLLGRWLGPVALAEYLLLRRVTVWFLAGSRLGMGTALPRYVAWAAGTEAGGKDCTTYFAGSAGFMMFSALCVSLALVAGRHTFAGWFFGSRDRSALVVALAALLIGLVAQSTVYGYYRGLLEMVRANALQVVSLSILPVAVVVLLARRKSVPLIVEAIGVVTVVLSLAFALPVLRRIREVRWPRLASLAGELLRYGIPRMPGDFGIAALLAVGPIIATHYLPMAKVAPLLLGISIVTAIGYAVSPVGIVLLSKVSMMLGQGARESVRSRLRNLAAAVPELSVFACVQLLVFADVAVRAWVGPKFLGDQLVVRLLILAIPPYLFYVMLRSTIDAVHVTPYNTQNVLLGLGLHAVTLAAVVILLPSSRLLEGIAASLLLALTVLGILTGRTFCRLYELSFPWRRSAPSILVALALGVVAWLFRFAQGSAIGPLSVLLLELALGFAYLAALKYTGSAWLHYAWEMARHWRAE